MDLLTALLQVLEIANEGIHLVNEDGVTVIYNKAASEFDGLSPNEVMGRHLLDVFPSLTHDSSTLLRVLRSGVPEIARQQTFSNYKGKKITTINSTHPIQDGGQIMGACEISTDITRIKEMAERITDLRKELRNKGQDSREQESVLSRKLYTVDDIIGESTVMRDVKRRVFQVARSRSNVVVWGETGTGKELIVQSIHSASDRAGFPFVPQNCAALPETLLESLVFGTSKGGFTGAQDRPGLLELASGGTLYLDEIDSMPLGLQAKLLRVIQEKRVRRLGDVRERPVDVRIIGSASVPPRHAVEHGILRADLYFRLAVVEIGLPPLRERREDIPLLCSHFLQKHSRRPVQVSISPQVMSAFLAYDWPGNVRELEHAIEGSLAFAKDNSIELDHIPWSVRGVTAATWMFKTRASTGSKASSEIESLGYGAHNENTDISKQESIRDQLRLRERRAVEEALKQAGSVSEAARILGMPRQTLQYRMKILGITRQNRRRRTK